MCKARDSLTMREVPLEKKVDMKYMLENVPRNKARMTKRGGDIHRVEGCFDLIVASKTYHEIFVNLSLSIFNRGLEDLLIL